VISIKHKGDFSKAKRYLERVKEAARIRILERYGQKGVAALAGATPKDTGLTADCWYYEVETKQGSSTISFHNSNIQNGVSIAMILQYGHGTGTGGWVQGRDYINPAIQPIFDEIANNAWREVTKL
jgi:hypothetical protein